MKGPPKPSPSLHPNLLSCPTHITAPYLGSLGRQVQFQLHKPSSPKPWPCSRTIPSQPTLRRPPNPEETCSYFLGGDFDLQELCLSGQHLPRGVYPDKDGSLAFTLQGTKEEEMETLRRTQLKFLSPQLSQTRSPDLEFLQFLVFSLNFTRVLSPPAPLQSPALFLKDPHQKPQGNVPKVWSLEVWWLQRKRRIKTSMFPRFET